MKKLFLFVLACTVPSFMFGQLSPVVSSLEKAAEVTGKGAGIGAERTAQAAIEAATTMPVSTGMRVGTLGLTGVLDPSVATGVKATTLGFTGVSNPSPNLSLDGIKRAMRRAGTHFLNGTVYLLDRWAGNDMVKRSRSPEQLYLDELPSASFFRVLGFKLGPKQKDAGNAFYKEVLYNPEAFANSNNFINALAAVTGLVYMATDETMYKWMVDFAKRAPEEYKFETDFVVIPALRFKGQYSLVHDLAAFRRNQERWDEVGAGVTLPLYHALANSEVAWREDLRELVPDDVRIFYKFSPYNFFNLLSDSKIYHKIKMKNTILSEIFGDGLSEYGVLGSLNGWKNEYPKYFRRIRWEK